ncbi:MAG: alpha/beta hydrolase fold domain-containing protein, partial [Planctomycetota bacterium]
MPVDPQVAAFLQRVAALNAPPIYTLTPEQARRTVPQIPPPYEPVASIENRSVVGPNGEIPVRIYTPFSAVQQAGRGPVPLLVLYHGGGWMVADVDSYDPLSRTIANAFDCIVISVDYRLSPEHKFPAGVEDSYAATVWAFEHARSLGADPQRIIVSGDSAGGNLAAAVSLMARDRQGPPIAHQLLIYPVTDCNFETTSYQENATGFMLTQQAMRWYWDAYLSDPAVASNPYAAPLQAADL